MECEVLFGFHSHDNVIMVIKITMKFGSIVGENCSVITMKSVLFSVINCCVSLINGRHLKILTVTKEIKRVWFQFIIIGVYSRSKVIWLIILYAFTLWKLSETIMFDCCLLHTSTLT